MSEPQRERLERRVLVLAPTPKDSSHAQMILHNAGIEAVVCPNVEALARDMERGVGAVLLAEEALAAGAELLSVILDRQPTWSDLPLLLITQHGADSPAAARALETLGNVTLVERPIRLAALVSTVRSALRARTRQYQARAHLQALEDADRRKDEFLATLAHELRNPLAPIRNSVSVLRLSAAPAIRPLIEIVDRQISHMVRLVDDLLEISRITRGKIDLRRSVVSLAAVVDAAVETSRPLISAGNHALDIDLPEEPLYLDADATRLAQVFANLLNNAAKYTEPGGLISVRAEREGGQAVVRVRDSGMGMPPSLLPRVFDMFAQSESTRDRAQGGLGIGLTLVRSLVGMHGGTVAAASEGAGKGSEFTVRLPLSEAGERRAAPRGAAELAPVQKPARVLVVDDNEDAADTLGMLLKMLGAEVQIVHDGPAALEAYATYQPGMVFLDIGMPGMDGYQVARRLRESGAKETTLIALTGWGQEKDRLNSAAAGFDHHLIKPIDVGALQALLAAADAAAA